jgi:hypothetical protein
MAASTTWPRPEEARSVSAAQIPSASRINEHVGLVDQPQHEPGAVRALQVDRDRSAAAGQDVVSRADLVPVVDRVSAVDADDVGAEVAEHHRAERDRAHRLDFEHPDTGQRTRGLACHRHTLHVT